MPSIISITSLQQETVIFKFFALIFLILFLSFFIDFFLSQSIFGKSYRIFVAPGIIIHELAHAFTCLLTGAKMTRISFFEKEGGRVEHHPSKLPIIGPILISIAPFVAGSAVIYLLSKKLGIMSINVTALDISKDGLINYFKLSLLNLDYKNLKSLAIVYLVLSIAVTMTPSFQDLRNMFLSIVFVLLAGVLTAHFMSFHLSNITIPAEIFTLLSTVFLLLILAFLLSIIIFAFSKLFK